MPVGIHRAVIDGDIERRILQLYTPDFYIDRPSHDVTSRMIKSAVSIFDYFLTMTRALPSIVNVETCPPDLLPLLGQLVGYRWKPTVSVEAQRQELRKIVDIYLIRGTPQSMIRIIMNVHASYGDVFVPGRHIFRWDRTRWDSANAYANDTYWRWGVYEVITNADFADIIDDLNGVHPAGRVRFGTRLISMSPDNPGDPETEMPMTPVVMHVYEDDYAAPAGMQYDDTLLALTPTGYWKLEESPDVVIAPDDSSAIYGDAIYGVSVYGGGDDVVAEDFSGNDNHGRYNIESEIIRFGDAVTSFFPLLAPSMHPLMPGSVNLSFDDHVAGDDGAGNLTGDATGTIDYPNGTLKNVQLVKPLGYGPPELPLAPGDPNTLPDLDGLNLLIEADAINLANSAPIVSFTDLSLLANVITSPAVPHQATYSTGILNGHKSISIGSGQVILTTNELDLTESHFIAMAVTILSHGSVTTFFAGTGCSIAHDWTAHTFTYTVNGQTVSVPYTLTSGSSIVLAIHRLGAAVNFYLAGSMIGTGTLTTQAAAHFKLQYIGAAGATGTNSILGSLQEAIATAVSLSNADNRNTQRYLGAKYGNFKTLAISVDVSRVAGFSNGDDFFQFNDQLGTQFTVGPNYGNFGAFQLARHWFKGDTILQGSGTLVALWQNSNGGATDPATQSSDPKKPTFNSNRLNGIGTVSFDGVDDEFVLTNTTSNTVATLSILFRTTDISRSWWICGDTVNMGVGYRSVADGGAAIRLLIGGTTTVFPFVLQANRWYLLQIERNGTAANLYMDDTLVSSGVTASGTWTITSMGHGGGAGTTDYFPGEIAEYAFRPVTPSVSTTRNTVDGLAIKWRWILPPRRATYVADGINGRPAMHGSYDPATNNGSAISVLSASTFANIGATLFFSIKTPDLTRYGVSGDRLSLLSGRATGVSRVAYSHLSSGSLIFSNDGGETSVTYKLASNTAYVIGVRRNRGTVDFFVNGLLVGTNTLPGGATDSPFIFRTLMNDATYAMQAGYNYDGMMSAFLLADVWLEDDEMLSVSQYLATRFSTPLLVPNVYPLRIFYNDYVERHLPGPINVIESYAARFGLLSGSMDKSYVQIPHVPGLSPGTGSYTIKAIFKLSSSNGGVIFGSRWIAGGHNCEISVRVDANDGQLHFFVNNGFASYTLSSGAPVNDDRWHECAAMLDATNKRLQLYVDAAIVDADDYLIAADLTPTSDFFIGSIGTDTPNDIFHGMIGRVAVFQHLITPLDIAVAFGRSMGGIVVDQNTVTFLVENDEPVGSFGIHAFALDESSLDGSDEIDGEDIVSVITGETWSYVLNPAGAMDRLTIKDRVQLDHVQRKSKLTIKDVVTYVIQRTVKVVDKMGANDNVSTFRGS